MESSVAIGLSGKPSNRVTSGAIPYVVTDEPTGDVADRASPLTETYCAEALYRLRQLETWQRERALERKQRGLQSLCEQCGKPIPKERLAAQPQATRCAPCQAQLEQSNHRGQPTGKLSRRSCRMNRVL